MDLSILKLNQIWSDAFVFITEYSTSNNLPYHNIKHTFDVFINSYKIGTYENLNEKEIAELGVSALFHDYNHSGGELTDDDNIKNAILGVEQFFTLNKNYSTQYNIENIIDTIKITRFPYLQDPQNISQKIIRDADLLQTFEDDWIKMVLFGLRKEMKLSMKEMLGIQTKFLENIKFNTDYANEVYKGRIGRNMSDIQLINSIYEKPKFTFLIKSDNVDTISDMKPENLSKDIWAVSLDEKISKDDIFKLLKNKGMSNFDIKVNEDTDK